MDKDTQRIVRRYVAARDGVERVRITHDGLIHAYGRMPNTDRTGWYFAGYAADIRSMAAAEARS